MILFIIILQLQCEVPETDSLVSLICTVASTDSIYENRPTDNPTATCLIEYILKCEIMETAKIGSYSG